MAISNVQRSTRGDRKYAAKKQAKSIEEVKFDPESRNEFLTGFHKRKSARQAEGRRRAEESNRQARLAERRRIREDRQKSISMGMDRLKEAENIIEGRVQAQSEGGSLAGKRDAEDSEDSRSGDDEEFNGFEESSGILKRRNVAYGNSNVTFEDINLDPYVDITKSEEVLDEATRKANEYAVYVASLEEQQRKAEEQQRKAQKKKKFRYLSKGERKLMTRKNKAR